MSKPADHAAVLRARLNELRAEHEYGHNAADRERSEEIKALDYALSAMEWWPIETAPKDGAAFCGASICAYVEGRPVWSFDEVWWNGEKFAKARPRSPPPTHWMPLPQPPQAAMAQDRGGTP